MIRLRRALAAVRWYLREVTGESRYEKYLLQHADGRDQTQVMTEQEFWREHARRREHAPPTRCC
ncbi:CstA-like transporter-associated (seleno)protein [Leifsonia sp. LS-T14]|uniref:CstA-like transporter-associated (seleno)protein n=1 Tax=unclassified Leifsonia TaxID=2663824 RepID=UPI0035A72D8D